MSDNVGRVCKCGATVATVYYRLADGWPECRRCQRERVGAKP